VIDTIQRFVADPHLIDRRVACYTSLLALPDDPQLPPRRIWQVYADPIFGDLQKANYACAYNNWRMARTVGKR
jgi:hypothetical protein